MPGRASTSWRCCDSSGAHPTPRRRRTWPAATTSPSTRSWRRRCTARPGEMVRHAVRHVGEDLPPRRRVAAVARMLADPGGAQRSLAQHCEVGARLADRLGMAETVCHSLAHAYERWDGKGYPAGLSGDEVPVAVRIVTVARDAELWTRQAGWATAVDVLTHRRGPRLRPRCGRRARRRRRAMAGRARRRSLCGGPGGRADARRRRSRQNGSTTRWRRSPTSPTSSHDGCGVTRPESPGSSSTPRRRPASPRTRARRSAGPPSCTTSGVSVCPVASGIGRGPLSVEQWERVRLHPYLTDRVLQRCSSLAPLADVASRHHERLDGSGYHRGANGRTHRGRRSLAGRRRRLPRHDRGSTSSAGAQAERCGRPARRGGGCRALRTDRGGRRARRRRPAPPDRRSTSGGTH